MKIQDKHFGITLLEIIVVLGIIALLSAASVPVISRYLPGIQLNGSTRTLTSTLREAQEKAITEQNQYLVRFVPQSIPISYRLIRIINSQEEQIREIKLSNNEELNLDQTISNNQIIFSADGGPSSSGNINLSLGGKSKNINVSPAGFIKIQQ